MKILMVVAVLLLVAGIVKCDVILGALAVSSLLFAGVSMLAVRGLSQQTAKA
jgi:hypothetical protein